MKKKLKVNAITQPGLRRRRKTTNQRTRQRLRSPTFWTLSATKPAMASRSEPTSTDLSTEALYAHRTHMRKKPAAQKWALWSLAFGQSEKRKATRKQKLACTFCCQTFDEFKWLIYGKLWTTERSLTSSSSTAGNFHAPSRFASLKAHVVAIVQRPMALQWNTCSLCLQNFFQHIKSAIFLADAMHFCKSFSTNGVSE